MYVGCDLASSVSRRKAAHPGADPVCVGGGLSKNLTPFCLLLQNIDGARCIVG